MGSTLENMLAKFFLNGRGGVVSLGFPQWLSGKEFTCNTGSAGDTEPAFNPYVRKIPWRRAWQPTPLLLPGESYGHRSLVGYSQSDHKESDRTEAI